VSDEFYRAAWSQAIAEAEGRAKQIREQSPRCDVCSRLVVTGGRRHHTCQPGSLAGLACHCPRGCTDLVWGDGGSCAPGCKPCRIMRGQVYRPL
jgi:hypothetical protein